MRFARRKLGSRMKKKVEPEVLVCDDCGTKEGVRETTCPYASEIGNKEIEITVCDNCYRERAMDI